MLLSLQLLPEEPAFRLLHAVAVADRLGHQGCYSADEIYHKDAWLLRAAAAKRTERIRLDPCVAPRRSTECNDETVVARRPWLGCKVAAWRRRVWVSPCRVSAP